MIRNSKNRKQFRIEDFEVGKCIGKGRFGDVHVSRYIPHNRIVVLKKLNKMNVIEEKLLGQVRREVEIHSRLKHPYIIQNYGYFQDSNNIYLVMEFASKGELFKLLQNVGRFSEMEVSKYIYQVTSAVSFLHRRGIVHRDLKPENILVMEDGTIKIADFGYVVQLENGKNRRSTRCGTLDYFAPEMVKGYKYDQSIDIWALGVLTYELLVGQAPFYERRENATLRKIKKGKITFPNFVKGDAKDFIKRLLVKEDYKRMNAEEALRHRFLRKYNWRNQM